MADTVDLNTGENSPNATTIKIVAPEITVPSGGMGRLDAVALALIADDGNGGWNFFGFAGPGSALAVSDNDALQQLEQVVTAVNDMNGVVSGLPAYIIRGNHPYKRDYIGDARVELSDATSQVLIPALANENDTAYPSDIIGICVANNDTADCALDISQNGVIRHTITVKAGDGKSDTLMLRGAVTEDDPPLGLAWDVQLRSAPDSGTVIVTANYWEMK